MDTAEKGGGKFIDFVEIGGGKYAICIIGLRGGIHPLLLGIAETLEQCGPLWA